MAQAPVLPHGCVGQSRSTAVLAVLQGTSAYLEFVHTSIAAGCHGVGGFDTCHCVGGYLPCAVQGLLSGHFVLMLNQCFKQCYQCCEESSSGIGCHGSFSCLLCIHPVVSRLLVCLCICLLLYLILTCPVGCKTDLVGCEPEHLWRTAYAAVGCFEWVLTGALLPFIASLLTGAGGGPGSIVAQQS